MSETAKVGLFCCDCNAETKHIVGRDPNGEFVALCKCGQFLKFPPSVPFAESVAKHNAHNKPADRPAPRSDEWETMKIGVDDVLVLTAEDLLK